MDNELNPYEAPTYSGSLQKPERSPQRDAARANLRLALVILLAPALYNYYCFDFAVFRNEELTTFNGFVLFSRIVNIGGMIAASLLLWFYSLPILELATKLIFRLFSRQSKLDDWQASLYDILGTVVYFALAGALLWMIWTIGFYDLNIGFYAISFPIGALAHLLAAGLYLRLAYRWYRIEQAAQVVK